MADADIRHGDDNRRSEDSGPPPITVSLHTLLDRTQATLQAQLPAPQLTAPLRKLYDGDLQWQQTRDRPHVIANFVTSLDGVVSYKLPGRAGGAAISGADPADRFIMGLLRASADAVMIGAGTLHDASPDGLWTADYICPSVASLYAEYRHSLRKSAHPLAVIVSASGRVDLHRAVFQTPGLRAAVVTTDAGRERLVSAGVAALEAVQVHVPDVAAGRIDPRAILEVLHARLGVGVLLHEGGPTLFGDFLAAAAVDEIFLTMAAQTVGRTAHTNRPGLVQGMEFLPEGAPWFALLSVKQRNEQLYLRYRCTGPRSADTPVTQRRDAPTRDDAANR